MGQIYTCNYTFNTPGSPLRSINPNIGNPKGGRLTAANPLWTSSSGNQVPSQPTLNGNTRNGPAGDQLQASVTFGTANSATLPSGKVTAAFTFTPANDASTGQAGASPFLAGGTFVCSTNSTQTAPQSTDTTNGTATYVFGPTPVYNGGLPGSYELTIVITDSSTSPVQWSTDPEFETGN